MKVTVLIPVRDEQEIIVELLHRIEQEFTAGESEIIVISDGSQDATSSLAATVPGVRVIDLNPGQGQGAAIQAGIKHASGEIILIQEANLGYDPSDYPALLKPIREGSAHVVYGSRWLGKKLGRAADLPRWSCFLGGRLLTWLTSWLYGAKMTDTATGCKVFKASLLREIQVAAKGFEFCPEITAKLLKQGIPILEVPIAYIPCSLAEEKKLRAAELVKAVWTLVKYRIS